MIIKLTPFSCTYSVWLNYQALLKFTLGPLTKAHVNIQVNKMND